MLKVITAFGALALAAALVVPTVSQAMEGDSIRVSYADLNLASAVGQHVLRGRIDEAASTVCGFENSRELELAIAMNFCRSDAIERARPAYEAAIASARHGTVTVLGSAALVVSAH